MDDRALFERLHRLLEASHEPWGVEVGVLDPDTIDPDYEIHPCGQEGVLAFLGDYVLVAWPDQDARAAARDAHRLIGGRLEERGFTRHMVHWRNFRSVKVTRKLGAKPVGVDADGYIHYILNKERFRRHG